jgi:hypothetical protein
VTNLGRLLSAADAERVLGIPRSTVATWHQRRERTGLYPAAKDSRNDPLFYEVDLIVLSRKLPLRDEAGERLHTMSDVTTAKS